MATPTQKRKRAVKLLLAEDNLSDALLIEEIFRVSQRPIHIDRVKDGQDVMDYLRGVGKYAQPSRPDLILMDLNMPRKSGLEALAEIKADPRLKNIIVIILTNSNLDSDLMSAYEHHANFYLIKPHNLYQLFEAMNHVEEIWMRDLPEEVDEG